MSFALAKLVPRTDSKPSSWVSYIVTTVPTYKRHTDPGNDTSINAATPTRPSTDNTGKLEAVAGKPGSYKYTFFRDVPGIKAQVDAMTVSAPNDKAALGDLSYDPSLPHRLMIQISGAAPGTGSNTSNGVTVTPTVNLANPVNVVYDFKPGPSGQPGTAIAPDQLTREDVNIDSCNVCHEKLAFHGGGARVETRYCVVCHTEQRGYGYANVASTAGKFPALKETATVNPVTGITSYSYDNDPNTSGSQGTNVADGVVSGNFTTMIHKIHQGGWLVKDNYHYAGIAFNNKGFSKLGGGQRMCTTCHDSKIASTADNHKKLPSRASCGACHDGIVWATGGGSTLADKQAVVYATDVLATSGHVGREQADDSKCALCHTAANIPVDHRMENLTKNNKYILPGLATFTYEIASAGVDATSNDLTIKFRIMKQVGRQHGQRRQGDAHCSDVPAPGCAAQHGSHSVRVRGFPRLPAGLCDAPGRHQLASRLQQPGRSSSRSRSAWRSRPCSTPRRARRVRTPPRWVRSPDPMGAATTPRRSGAMAARSAAAPRRW